MQHSEVNKIIFISGVSSQQPATSRAVCLWVSNKRASTEYHSQLTLNFPVQHICLNLTLMVKEHSSFIIQQPSKTHWARMVIFKTSLIPLAQVLIVHSFFISKSQPYLESERSDFCQRPLKNEIRRVYSLSWLETSINLFRRAKILSATLKKKCEPPYLKTCHSLAGKLGRVSLVTTNSISFSCSWE